MRKKAAPLFGSSLPVSCAYCEHNLSPEGDAVCRFKLSLSPEGRCKRYRYNPMLRAPKPQPVLPEFDPEEFKL